MPFVLSRSSRPQNKKKVIVEQVNPEDFEDDGEQETIEMEEEQVEEEQEEVEETPQSPPPQYQQSKHNMKTAKIGGRTFKITRPTSSRTPLYRPQPKQHIMKPKSLKSISALENFFGLDHYSNYTHSNKVQYVKTPQKKRALYLGKHKLEPIEVVLPMEDEEDDQQSDNSNNSDTVVIPVSPNSANANIFIALESLQKTIKGLEDKIDAQTTQINYQNEIISNMHGMLAAINFTHQGEEFLESSSSQIMELPLKTNTEFDEFESRLINDENQKRAIAKKLLVVQGRTPRILGINMMKQLFTDLLATQFSLLGKNDKRIFQSTQSFKLICALIKKFFPTSELTDVRAGISDWLSQAKFRMQRKQSKGSSREEEEDFFAAKNLFAQTTDE